MFVTNTQTDRVNDRKNKRLLARRGDQRTPSSIIAKSTPRKWGMTRGWLPQRTGSPTLPSLNDGGEGATVPSDSYHTGMEV